MGKCVIPNRLSGGQKPHIADMLANFDAICDFCNQVSNPSNIGTLDQNNFNDQAVNARVGLNSTLDATRRAKSAIQGVFGAAWVELARATVTIPGGGLVFLCANGTAQLSGSSPLTVALFEDDIQLTVLQQLNQSAPGVDYDWYLGSKTIQQAPLLPVPVQFQFRAEAEEAVIFSGAGSHKYSIKAMTAAGGGAATSTLTVHTEEMF